MSRERGIDREEGRQGERERAKEREHDRESETETETETETEKETEREREKEKERKRETQRQTGREPLPHTDRQRSSNIFFSTDDFWVRVPNSCGSPGQGQGQEREGG